MAAARRSFRYLGGAERVNPLPDETQFEFDEAEIWNSNGSGDISSSEAKKSGGNLRPVKKLPIRKSINMENHRPPAASAAAAARSLPVNIPDWSKILRGEYKNHVRDCEDDVEDDDDENDEDGIIPPHEYLARTRVASFSVHEGVGRTLKGRDLSRVRNAIWKQTGFED